MNHLTLSQCQRLKELGYPQKDSYFWAYIQEDGTGVVGSHADILSSPKAEEYYATCVACPVLEELIDWLGNDFGSLEYYHKREIPVYFCRRKSGEQDWSTEYAPTPLEAVYQLCIAIKYKQPEV